MAEHCMRDCSWTAQFRDMFPVNIGRGGESVAEWVAEIWQGLSVEHRNLYFTALWGLWFDINQLLFQKKVSSQGAVFEWVCRHRREFLLATAQ
ncbi:hypothetical protein ACS0TY_009202 [Phlomoides rotata]